MIATAASACTTGCSNCGGSGVAVVATPLPASARVWAGVPTSPGVSRLPQQQLEIFVVWPQSCCFASHAGWRPMANAEPLVVATSATTNVKAENRPIRPVTILPMLHGRCHGENRGRSGENGGRDRESCRKTGKNPRPVVGNFRRSTGSTAVRTRLRRRLRICAACSACPARTP